MFSLIITIISIALVAVLALATLYYGGDAFNKGSADAQAAKIVNQSQQLQGAAEMYFVDNKVMPASVDALIAGGYLKSAPVALGESAAMSTANAAAGGTWVMPLAQTSVFAVSIGSEEACGAVNQRMRGTSEILTEIRTGVLVQCYNDPVNGLTVVTAQSTQALLDLAAAVNDGSAPSTLTSIVSPAGLSATPAAFTDAVAPAPAVNVLTAVTDGANLGNGPSTVTFTNDTAQPHTVTSVAFDLGSIWTVVSDACTGITLAPSESCVVNLMADNSSSAGSGSVTANTAAGPSVGLLAFNNND